MINVVAIAILPWPLIFSQSSTKGNDYLAHSLHLYVVAMAILLRELAIYKLKMNAHDIHNKHIIHHVYSNNI